MGSNSAQDFAEAVREGAVSIDAALEYHLVGNHYPPLPRTLIPCAKQAIAAVEAGNPEDLINLPAGILWKGKPSAPALECVNAWHLGFFIQGDEFGE